MKTFFLNILLPVALLIISVNISSCSKSNIQNILPPQTHNGSNTMGAYINNAVWNPVESIYGTGIKADYSGTAFSIVGNSNNTNRTERTSVDIEINNFTGLGNYLLNDPPSPVGSPNSGRVLIVQNIITIGQNPVRADYSTDSLYNGSVTITYFDAAKRIVSGTFQINAVNQKNQSDVVHVTSGRFDFACPVNTVY
jgi:hypothetical protein